MEGFPSLNANGGALAPKEIPIPSSLFFLEVATISPLPMFCKCPSLSLVTFPLNPSRHQDVTIRDKNNKKGNSNRVDLSSNLTPSNSYIPLSQQLDLASNSSSSPTLVPRVLRTLDPSPGIS